MKIVIIILNNCCSDIADIGCHPTSSFSPIVSLTPTYTLGKTKFCWIVCHLKIILLLFIFIIKYYISRILVKSNIILLLV